jgi:hypothetical protein
MFANAGTVVPTFWPAFLEKKAGWAWRPLSDAMKEVATYVWMFG